MHIAYMKKIFDLFVLFFLTSCISYADIKEIDYDPRVKNITTNIKNISNEEVQLIGKNGIRVIITESTICTVTVDLPPSVPKERIFNTLKKQIEKCQKGNSPQEEQMGIYREKKFFDIKY